VTGFAAAAGSGPHHHGHRVRPVSGFGHPVQRATDYGRHVGAAASVCPAVKETAYGHEARETVCGRRGVTGNAFGHL
jgi:hypothetical protein